MLKGKFNNGIKDNAANIIAVSVIIISFGGGGITI